MKGKALRRALKTSEAHRISGDVPLITDETVLMTAERAHEHLRKMRSNRPTNWKRVERYAGMMERGEWELTGEPIILDPEGYLLSGQNRLWAVIYSGRNVYIRISRGTPSKSARVLDRGAPQSARDLATRGTGRKHSPIEGSIARGMLALGGNLRPSADVLAAKIEANSRLASQLLLITAGAKKSKAVIMVLAAVSSEACSEDRARELAKRVNDIATELDEMLRPQSADKCWGRGAAFALAMEHARKVVRSRGVDCDHP